MHYYNEFENGYFELFVDWRKWRLGYKSEKLGPYAQKYTIVTIGPVQLTFSSFKK